MSITSVKSGATGISLALDNNFMEPIATTLVGSGGSDSITFNDIPQIYKHLQIRYIGRTNRASNVGDTLSLRLNSDTGTNYYGHYMIGTGASVLAGSYGSTNIMYIGSLTGASAGSSTFGTGMLDILDYSNTNKYKTIRSLDGEDNNDTNGVVGMRSGVWNNTAAVTTITLTRDGGTLFSQYSRFSLYGIKG